MKSKNINKFLKLSKNKAIVLKQFSSGEVNYLQFKKSIVAM